MSTRKNLAGLPLVSDHSLDSKMAEDDIMVSSFLKRKVLPGILAGRFVNLPEGEVALSKRPGHGWSRRAACNYFFQQKRK